jgi:hypothetical protein
MKTKYRYILSFVFLALLATVLIWKYTFRKSDTSVASQKATVEIAASKLAQAFEIDENAANTLYLDKIVSVSGTVESVSEDSLGVSVYLKDSTTVAGIICSFDKTAIDVSAIEKGLPVRIKGICSGFLMDVVMNKCSLESGGTKR